MAPISEEGSILREILFWVRDHTFYVSSPVQKLRDAATCWGLTTSHEGVHGGLIVVWFLVLRNQTQGLIIIFYH